MQQIYVDILSHLWPHLHITAAVMENIIVLIVIIGAVMGTAHSLPLLLAMLSNDSRK